MIALLVVAACRSSEDSGGPACSPAEPAWDGAVTTLTRTIALGPVLDAPMSTDPAFPDGLADADALGLGTWSVGPGEARTLRDDLAPGHGADAGPARQSVLFFFHESDAQIADAESPVRMARTDNLGEFESAARPQELYAIHALDALIRAADDIDADHAFDFGLATGDDADNSQTNELGWFRDVWDGAVVDPDSGGDDTQVDADCNDPIAPFDAVGATFPWYAVAGNHDVLVQGNFDKVGFVDKALGNDAPLGTRDLSLPGGPLAYWSNVADPDRALLDRDGVAARLLDSPAVPGPPGHGFVDGAAYERADWVAHPVDGLPIEVVCLDMNPDGPSDGSLSAAERDGFLIPTLEAAQSAGDLVIVTSHYATLGREVEGGGTVDELLVQYPNVILSVAGHNHRNAIDAVGAPDDPGAYWEIRTSATVDWPGQGRLVELVANGDGTLSIYTTMLDYLAPEGSLAAEARRLTAIDLQSGWRVAGDGSGTPADRNTELVERLPDGITLSRDRGEISSLELP